MGKVTRNPQSPFKQSTNAYPGKAGDLKPKSSRVLSGNESEGLAPQSAPMGKLDKSYVRNSPDGNVGSTGRRAPISGTDDSCGDAESELLLQKEPTMTTLSGLNVPPSQGEAEFVLSHKSEYQHIAHFATAKVLAEGHNTVTKEAAFHEVYHNTPKIVKHTAAKFGKADAEKQRVAIALSKAGLSRKSKGY